MSELTEVLGADPDGEVLLGLLRKTHAFHDLLHRRVVAVLELHGAIWAVHAVDSHFLILWNTHMYNEENQVKQHSPLVVRIKSNLQDTLGYAWRDSTI